MAYETGVSTGVTAMLGTIRAFADELGWTIDRDDTNELALHHATAGYFTLIANPQEDDINTVANPEPSIEIFGQTGFDAGASHTNQPGTSAGFSSGRTNGLRGPFTAYHLFGTQQYIHCVIEIVPGEFAHLHFGRLETQGDYVGGEYFTGTLWYYLMIDTSPEHARADDRDHAVPFDCATSRSGGSGAVRMDVAGYTSEWARFDIASPSSSSTAWGPMRAYGSNVNRTPFQFYSDSTPNTVNAVTPFNNLLVVVNIRNQLGFFAGAPLDLRMVNMKNLVPGETITIGPDEWLVFPVKKRGATVNGPQGEVNSWTFGYAYRKVPL
jgi:hypothetical protein